MISVPKPVTKAVTPSGKLIAKTGNYTHVLVHDSRELNKWSNSLAVLQIELEQLVKCGWNRDELHIIETKNF